MIIKGVNTNMNMEEKNYINILKMKGFTLTNDKLGMYFDKGNKKFSIIKIGDIYNCYFNERNDEHSGYVLKDNFVSQIQLTQCLRWILSKKD